MPEDACHRRVEVEHFGSAGRGLVVVEVPAVRAGGRSGRPPGHRPAESDALTYLGLVQKATGDPGQAAGNLRRALDLYRDLGDRLGEAQALNHLGELLGSARAASARAHHEQALEIATSIGASIDQARALGASAAPACTTGSPVGPPRRYARRWPSTRSSDPCTRRASRRSCATTISREPGCSTNAPFTVAMPAHWRPPIGNWTRSRLILPWPVAGSFTPDFLRS